MSIDSLYCHLTVCLLKVDVPNGSAARRRFITSRFPRTFRRFVGRRTLSRPQNLRCQFRRILRCRRSRGHRVHFGNKLTLNQLIHIN